MEERLKQFNPYRDRHVDIVFRGTADSKTPRCEWHGYAETNEEREFWLRTWMELSYATPMPPPSEIERVYLPQWERIPPDDFAKRKALIYGGLVEDIHLYLYCTVDYRVHEYLLGDGPGVIPVMFPVGGRAFHTYEMYRKMAQWPLGKEPTHTEAEYQAVLDSMVHEAFTLLSSLYGNREVVLMLIPLYETYFSIAVEGWRGFPAYDIQRSADGTISAVAFGVPNGHPEQKQTLDNLRSRVAAAGAYDPAAGERIANIADLTQYYRDIGAYDDITPHDGIDNPFTPAKPP